MPVPDCARHCRRAGLACAGGAQPTSLITPPSSLIPAQPCDPCTHIACFHPVCPTHSHSHTHRYPPALPVQKARLYASSALQRRPSFHKTMTSSPCLITNWSRPVLSSIQLCSCSCASITHQAQRGAARAATDARQQLRQPASSPCRSLLCLCSCRCECPHHLAPQPPLLPLPTT